MFSTLKCFLLCTVLCLPFCETFDEEECKNLGGITCYELEDICNFGFQNYMENFKTAESSCNEYKSEDGRSVGLIMDHEQFDKESLLICLMATLGNLETDLLVVWDKGSDSKCDSGTYTVDSDNNIKDFTITKDVNCSQKLHYFCYAK